MIHNSSGQQGDGSRAEISLSGSIVSGSAITAQNGSGNRAVIRNREEITGEDLALVAARQELGARLTVMKKALQDNHDPARATDREDAIEAVTAVHADLDKGMVADQKTLRQRVKALIGLLQPVADIIGGVAALETIARGR
jgi:hypothetical protein